MALFLVSAANVAIASQMPEDQVREAIVDAVRDRMGRDATVSIDTLTIDAGIDAATVRAIPEPGSRLGRAIRFTLRADGLRRTGSATAHLTVSVPHAHAAHALDRGVDLSAADVERAAHDIADGPLRALPSIDDAARARTIRPLAKDACVVAAAIASVPPVRGGHDVVAVVRVGDVEARTTVTASQSGEAGDVIRVVNRQSKRPLKARVVSEGLVEIIHD